MEIHILQEFKDLIPPLTGEELCKLNKGAIKFHHQCDQFMAEIFPSTHDGFWFYRIYDLVLGIEHYVKKAISHKYLKLPEQFNKVNWDFKAIDFTPINGALLYPSLYLIKPKEGEKDNLTSIYFILDRKSNAVKIGVSQCPESRLRQLQVGNPNKLELIHSYSTHFLEEKTMHLHFSNQQIGSSEWFWLEGILFEHLKTFL